MARSLPRGGLLRDDIAEISFPSKLAINVKKFH